LDHDRVQPPQHCDKTSTPLFFLYFPYQNNPMCHGQGDPTIGRPGDQPEDIRLDNHLHNWLARPATLRLCQRCAPDRSNAYTIYWSTHDPQNHFATIQNCRWPSAQTTLFAPLFSFGQYKTCTFVVRLFCHRSSMTSCRGWGILPYLSIHSVVLLS
jgi:hypothetical protein